MASIDKREYADCGECGRRKLVEGTGGYNWYVCDGCGQEMNPNEPHNEPHLEASVHQESGDGAGYLHYCSWVCLAKHLPTVECEWFISLPYLKYDERKPENQSAAAFLEIMAAGLKALGATE